MINYRVSISLLIGALIIFLFFLQYQLWFANDGIKDMLKIKKILQLQKQENEALKKRNDELLFQIERLQNSHEETESRARSELGMIKKNETFYQVVK